MFIVTPDSVIAYSRCPKKYQLSFKNETTKKENIVEKVVKGLYIYHLKTGKIASWKYVLYLTERQISSNIFDTVLKERYKKSKGYLQRISNWYDLYYLDHYADPGFINVPLIIGLGYKLTFNGSIDIVSIGKKTRLFDVYELDDNEQMEDYTGINLYDDLIVHIQAWAFWRATETFPDEYVRIVIGPNSIRPVKITFTHSILMRTEGIVRQITRGIQDEIFYPVYSEQCYNCSFKEGCHL